MKILIAEDDKTSRNLLSMVLSKQGHEVVETADGAQAWQTMQQADAPKMAILDWMMPEIDGPEVVRRIRTLQSGQPPYIIMLTAKSGKSDIIAGLDAGANDYLSKPFDPGELRARIGVGCRMLEMQANLNMANSALAHEARHDSLTGIMNRRSLMDNLSREIARDRRQHNGLTIGMCDIDHFKKINDLHGHMVGDEVLCGVVRLLEKCLRQFDSLGRFGGEEFVLITPGVQRSDAKILYERFRIMVADNPIRTNAGDISVTISIGVAVYNGNGKLEELLNEADTSLYEAKRKGRNKVCLARAIFAE